ncbi:MAG: glutamate-1-semialdehyde 2,1-aminomutase [Proteobacteria bacterium]|nr:glutamate-1-semialdehyde 2,1-aminomutase [Pseudomonadota bacterium]
MRTENSEILFKKAQEIIPGGVNSPVRACKSVHADPLVISSGNGSKLYDVDGNEFIDYVGSWGPLILGHRHPMVMDAIASVLKKGISFGAPTELEIELASLVIEMVPSIEMVRMVNSGTEATMSALRLARGFTGRDIIIKFDGCYHGHADSLLVEAGSGVATLDIKGSPGVPESVVKHTLSLPYNDPDLVIEIMKKQGNDVACIIVEPVAGNMGMVPPGEGFLETLRSETEKYGSLLIFDEVMTGFRVARGGAQERYGIKPDLTCLGKIIGGGMPVGAYGGRKDIMSKIAPQGPVYQAGTLSGNPVAMAAGIATLTLLKEKEFYKKLEAKTGRLVKGLSSAVLQSGVKATCGYVGSMFGLFFTDKKVISFKDAKTSDINKFALYYKKMREQGIYLAPSQFEAGFVSMAHSDEDIEKTVKAAGHVLSSLA